MEFEKFEYYIFGSFLKKEEYRDIDVLVVVQNIIDISAMNTYISSLRESYPDNLVHTHIYIQSEYLNSANKFNYKKVKNKISPENFIELFKMKR